MRKGMILSMKSLKSMIALALLPALTACSPILEYELSGSRTTAELFTAPPGQTVTAASADRYPSPRFRTSEEILGTLAEFDGGGSIFLIATMTDDPDNPVFPQTDRISRNAAIERLNAIQDKYNLKIAESPTSPGALAAELKENIEVDGYTVDLILMPADNCSPLLDEKLILDPSRIAFFDPQADYLDQAVAKKYSDLAVWGDALLCPEDRLCVFYNAKLAESLSVGSLYPTVAAGKWTLDELIRLAGLGGVCGNPSPEYLVGGIYGQPGDKIAALPDELRESAQASLEALSKVYRVPDSGSSGADADSGAGADANADSGGKTALDAFIAGQSLLYVGKLSDCAKLSGMADAWSLLPLPSARAGESAPLLHEEGQREYIFLIPRFPYSPERSVQIIQALCSLCDGAKQAVYEGYLPYLRLNEARILLETVLKG